MTEYSKLLTICFVTAFPPLKKGEAEYAHEYVEAFLRYNNKVRFHVISQKVSSRETKENLPSFNYSLVKVERIFDPSSLIDRNIAVFKIFRKICQFRPNIVHLTYGPNTDYGGRIGEPLLLLFLCLKIMRIPIVVTLHSTWFPKDIENRVLELGHSKFIAKVVMAYFTIFTRVFTRLVDRVLLLTTIEYSPITTLYSHIYKLPREKICIEPHGCSFNPISSIEEKEAKIKLSLGKNKKIILSFGFIRKDKGFEYLIDAFSRIYRKNYLLIIAGSPKERRDRVYLNSLLKLCESLGIKNKVIFDIRYVPDEMLKLYIDAADVIVFPYVRNVGASGPLHYALSRGKPVIASRVGHMHFMKDIIMLVKPADSTELANAISKILINRQFREKIKVQALKYAKEHDWSRVTELNFSVYKKLANIII